uniref:Uncharacterized protein n=1 Tax=Branchiostoma floridae TaxID=7739 RepID=C3ZUN8_BRAFL|eukprot:XP_002587739.1 hypothetical protein BRAFLDRAFT_94642 [Branchiostoma floridae]
MKTTTAARARVRKMSEGSSEDEDGHQSSVSEDEERQHIDDPGVQRGQQTTPTTGPLRPGEPLQPREDRRCPVYSLAGQREQQTTSTIGRLRLSESLQPRTREDRRCPV